MWSPRPATFHLQATQGRSIGSRLGWTVPHHWWYRGATRLNLGGKGRQGPDCGPGNLVYRDADVEAPTRWRQKAVCAVNQIAAYQGTQGIGLLAQCLGQGGEGF
jgi:hypothetical protein